MTGYYNGNEIKGVFLGTQNTNCLTHIPNDINLTLDPLNVTVIGSPTVNSGVVSGFSSANYLTLPDVFSPASNTWELVYKIKFSNVSAHENFIGCKNQNFPLVKLYNSKFMMYVSSNGSSWNVASEKTGTFVPTANTYYWIKLRFTGSAYILSYSTNGTSFTDDITISSTATIKGGFNLIIGHSWTDRPFTTGTVDLTGCYIKIGNSIVWQGGTGKVTLKKGSKVYVPNGWTNYKYYKYTYANWTQPVLTANGTVGGTSYAVRVSTEYTSDGNHRGYRAFDGSKTTQWEANVRNTSQWIEFYSPVELKVSSIDFVNRSSSSTTYTKWKLTVSNDGTNYITIKTFDTGSSSNGASWSVSFDMSKGYKYFKLSVGDSGALTGSDAKPSFAEITFKAKEVTGTVESTANDYDYKVGSGSMIFDEVVISSDKAINNGWHDKRFLFIDNGKNLAFEQVAHSHSGDNPPTDTNTYLYWYDTKNNIIKSSNNKGESWAYVGHSLPIAIITTGQGSISSIDQTFNGFGYIGMHKFRTKGIKFLASNGINPDGTYKSTEIETTDVLLKDSGIVSKNNWFDLITKDTWYSNTRYYVQNTAPTVTTNSYWYNPNENKLYRWSGSEWQQRLGVVCGRSVSSNNKVTSITPNPVQPEKIGREISRIYKGSTIVYGYKPSEVLIESNIAGTYTLNLEHSGDYEVTIVGGGGGGAYNVSTSFSDGVISGGSGAGFKGVIHLESGIHTVQVGAGGTSVNPGNQSTAKPSVGSSSFIGNVITAGCANADGTANAGYHGSGNVISKGGVLTYDKSAVRSYTIATNGNDGLEGWNTSVEGASSVISGTTYGAGDKGQNSAMSKGYDGYVKVVAI